MTATVGHLYFHCPCFDGIASAVLVGDFFEATGRWSRTELHPVNYDLKESWLRTELRHPSAVVDFLYHPSAGFWADHHATTFLSQEQRLDPAREPSKIYDRESGSCGLLLYRELSARYGYRNPQHEELARWADRIDAARYESPEEAIFPTSAALRINASLAIGERENHAVALIGLLREKRLRDVADLPIVKERAAEFDRLVRGGQARLEQSVTMDDSIITFDVDETGVLVSRYAPFLSPDRRSARYSAGIVRFPGGAKVTTMRNPWLDFESVPLGELCAKYGGGGHQRVGSILMEGARAAEARVVLKKLVQDIRAAEKRQVSLR